MYPENIVYDSDSMLSYSSSSSGTDGAPFSDTIHEWFNMDQTYQQEMPQHNTVYTNDIAPVENYWQYESSRQSEASNYTYIFDTLPNYGNNDRSNESSGTSGKVRRRRVQTPHQRKAANVRERRRMCTMNNAFDELRKRLPAFDYEKKLSRIETLKLAMTYISFMKDLSEGQEPHDINLPQYQRHFKDKSLNIMNENSK